MAVSIPPTVQVSDWVGQLKGASAHYLNQRITNRNRFAWQAGYGVVSFGSRDLAWVTDYIRSQREHTQPAKPTRVSNASRPSPACERLKPAIVRLLNRLRGCGRRRGKPAVQRLA